MIDYITVVEAMGQKRASVEFLGMWFYDLMKDKMILVFEKDREWLMGSQRSSHCEDRI